jgi:tetratricopeptide (TPR) repeat protein
LLIAVASLVALGVQPAKPPSSLGRISFPTSGSAAAQAPFIRGLLLLHSFEYDDAIEAFRQAQRIDARFAMAYWGEALAYNQPLWYNENLEKGRAALARLAPTRAARQAKAPTAREQAYLDAVEKLFGEGGKPARDRAYADAMGELTRRFPDDQDAAALYALALLATVPSGQRDTALSLKAGAIAAAVLEKNPEHPGAAHYALHAFDDGEHAAMGLKAARIYARIAPASSHARHMPSHVFLPLGMWDDAVAADESAFAASVDRVKRLGLSMAQADFHSLSWLHYEYLQQGRFTKAREVMKTVESAIAGSAPTRPGRPTSPTPPAPPAPPAHADHVESEIGRGFGPMSLKGELASMKARLVLENGDWKAMQGQPNFDNIDELFALGVASVALNDPGRATAALEHLTGASTTLPDRDAREIAQIMAAQLEGMMRLGRGDRPGALASLARAAGLEARRPTPVARPYPVKPAGELYAEILLGTGDAAAAIAQFKASLARTPRRAASLLGLARAASAAGQAKLAADTAREFLNVWRLADKDRPELAEARTLARPQQPRRSRSKRPRRSRRRKLLPSEKRKTLLRVLRDLRDLRGCQAVEEITLRRSRSLSHRRRCRAAACGSSGR